MPNQEFDAIEAAYQASLASQTSEEDPLPFPVEPEHIMESGIDPIDGSAFGAVVASGPRAHPVQDEVVADYTQRIAELEQQLAELQNTPANIAPSLLDGTSALDMTSTNLNRELWCNRAFWVSVESIESFVNNNMPVEGSIASDKLLMSVEDMDSFKFEDEFQEQSMLTKIIEFDTETIYLQIGMGRSIVIDGNTYICTGTDTPFLLKLTYEEFKNLNTRSLNTSIHHFDDWCKPSHFIFRNTDFQAYETAYQEWVIANAERLERNKTFVEDLEKSLELAYPGSWDVMHGNANMSEDVRSYSSTRSSDIIAVIKYDNITITNRDARSHEIEDLFVFIRFKLVQGTYKIRQLKGMRSTFTGNEWGTGYIHSHLPGESRHGPQGFCLGSGTPMSNMMAELQIDFSWLKFDFMLNQLNSYVRYESLEGGPYSRMENISGRSRYDSPLSNNVLNTIYSRYVRRCLDNDSLPNVSLDTGEVTTFKLDIFDHYFQEGVMECLNGNDNATAEITSANEFKALTSVANNYTYTGSDLSRLEQYLFKFQGNDVIRRIKPNVVQEGSQNRIVPKKEVLEYISNRMSKETKDYLLKID